MLFSMFALAAKIDLVFLGIGGAALIVYIKYRQMRDFEATRKHKRGIQACSRKSTDSR
jgi:hypothetical protein